MKPLRIQDDLVPIGDFKTHASQYLRRLHEDRRPLVITQRGKASGVLLTPEDYDALTERARFVEAVAEGLAESETEAGISNDALSAHFEQRFRETQGR